MDPRSIRQLPLLAVKIPSYLADLAQANLDQTRNALAAAAETADVATRGMAEGYGAAIRCYLTVGEQVFARARASMEGNLDLASALVRARTPAEVAEAVTAHARRQFGAIPMWRRDAGDTAGEPTGEFERAAGGVRDQAREAA